MCTNIKITSKSNSVFFGRTMDLNTSMFGEDPGLDLNVVTTFFPKGSEIPSQLNTWTSKYSVLGVGTENTSIIYDGINEKGLAGDCQVLLECTKQSLESIINLDKIPLIGEEFVTYVLTNFKSVEEIKKNYTTFMLTDVSYIYKDNRLNFPLHYTFVDESGDGIVLEPVFEGGFKLYDYVDVMTNSPEYDYHLNNIRNYIGLNNYSVKEKYLDNNTVLEPIENGTGYGLFGIPGDYTSPSRFVRSFVFKNMIDPFDDINGINYLYSLFRSVIVPRGLEHNSIEDKITDYTRYWSGYDLKNKIMYVQTGQALSFTMKKLNPGDTKIKYGNIQMHNNFSDGKE